MELEWKRAGDAFYAVEDDAMHVVSKVTTCGWVYLSTSVSGVVHAPKTSYHSATDAMTNGPKSVGVVITRNLPWVPQLGERVKPSKNFLRRFFHDWHDVKEIVITRTELVFERGKLAWIECNCAEHYPNHKDGDTYMGFLVYPGDPEKNDIEPLE